MAKLDVIYRHLCERSAHTSNWQSASLAGGARVSVKLALGRARVVFSRTGKRLGDAELATFIRYCQIPETARREPADPAIQATKTTEAGPVWYVEYRWTGAAMFAGGTTDES
jgi:hypothetical protein